MCTRLKRENVMRINSVMPMKVNKPSFGELTNTERMNLDDVVRNTNELLKQNFELIEQNKKLSHQNKALSLQNAYIMKAINLFAKTVPRYISPFLADEVDVINTEVNNLNKTI